MKVESDISLKDYNTFKVDCCTETLICLEKESDFSKKVLEKYIKSNPFLILGGGSNILFTKDFKGTILLIKNKGKKILNETEEYIDIQVNAGEDWDHFVQWCVKKELLGIHNLALIPGTVGATPIQNVGAYGIEIKDLLLNVTFLNLEDWKEYVLENNECKFGYRDSIFKNELKDKVIVKSITLRLKKYKGEVDSKYLEYSGIKEELEGKDINPENIYNAIVKIRESKLPKVQEYGSCGSTFKNPEINIKEYERLLKIYPELPKYDTDKKDIVKIPAAYILEKLGWKNKREGEVGTWIYHPLIITNYSNASGNQIYSFIKKIQHDFKSNTNLDLECEINIF